MYMRWMTGNWDRRIRPSKILWIPSCILLFIMAGCSLVPAASDAELIELIEAPKISQKPEYTVALSTIETKVSATGRLMSEMQENLYFFEDNKRIEEIRVKPGEQIHKGQIIAIIENDSLGNQIRKKDIEVRQAELKMIERLREEEEQSPLQTELDQLNYEILKEDLADLKNQQERSQLTAPFDGTLVSFNKKVGDTVKAYEEVGLFADLTKLAVAAKFSSSDLQSIVVGMDAVVNINTAGTFTGKVSRLPLDTTAGDDSIESYLLIELDEFPKDMQAGTPLSISVITERKEDVVLIPPAALRTHSGRNYVQIIDEEGNKSEVDVEIGISTATEIEIIKGLIPGQKVIGK